MKNPALLSDKIINKIMPSWFSGNNLNVTFPKYFLCSYLMLTNYKLLMADIREPVRNVPLWL